MLRMTWKKSREPFAFDTMLAGGLQTILHHPKTCGWLGDMKLRNMLQMESDTTANPVLEVFKQVAYEGNFGQEHDEQLRNCWGQV